MVHERAPRAARSWSWRQSTTTALVHMVQAGEKVRMAVEVQTQFHDDLMAYNTMAEIPGTDRKE